MAALVFFQLWWGWRTTFLDPGYDKADGYVVHAQIGAAILIVACLRLGWRVIAPFVAPKLEEIEDLPGWQRLAAEATLLIPAVTVRSHHHSVPWCIGRWGSDPGWARLAVCLARVRA